MPRLKFITLLSLHLLLAGAVMAQERSMAGNWDIMVSGPLGGERILFQLKQDGNAWHGSGHYLGHELALSSGKIEGGRFSAVARVNLGIPLTAKLWGTVDRDTIKGVIVPDIQDLPGMPFGGRRSALAAPALPTLTEAQQENFKKVKRLFVEAWILYSQGSTESLRAAREKLVTVQNFYQELGSRQQAAEVLFLTSYISDQLGEFASSLEFGRRALQLRQEMGDKDGESRVLNSIGQTYRSLGEADKALEYFNQALPKAVESGNRFNEVTALHSIGSFYAGRKKFDLALASLRQGVAISREIGSKASEVRLLGELGYVYLGMKDYDKALAVLEESLSLSRSYRERGEERTNLARIAQVYKEKGETEKAVQALQQYLVNPGFGEPKLSRAATLHTLCILYAPTNPNLAIFFGKLAANLVHETRSEAMALTTGTQQSFLRRVEVIYRDVAQILLEQNRLSEAQQVLNAFKDQQFYDAHRDQIDTSEALVLTLRETGLASRFKKATERVTDAVQTLDVLSSRLLEREPNSQEIEQIKQVESRLRLATDELASVLRAADSQILSPDGDESASLDITETEHLRKVLREMSVGGQQTAAIYTLMGPKKLHALVLTRDEVFSVSAPVTDVVLNEKALQLWRLLRTPKYDPQPLARELYDTIFAAIDKKLPKDVKTLMWSLDGSLRYLPMSVLHDGKSYLAERYNNVVFTRADKDRLTRTRSRDLSAVGLGTSQAYTVDLRGERFIASGLPGVQTELKTIFGEPKSAGVLKGDVLTNAQFTKSAMLSSLKTGRPIVHIASHFKFEPGDESRSFLLLGDGTPFTLDQMKSEKDLFKGVDLLTLSACQTAAQRPDANGREVDGFAELAQRLGAGAVMASLWEVSDSSTAELMSRFYKNYVQTGMNKADAIRHAQLALLTGDYKKIDEAERQLTQSKNDAESIKIDPTKLRPFKPKKDAPYAHPYYWSPFILIGNWK